MAILPVTRQYFREVRWRPWPDPELPRSVERGAMTGLGVGSDNPVTSRELERLAALRRYRVLDTPPDGTFDRITSLAARLFDVPVSIVSLVDQDRIWFKSRYGVDAEQVPRSPGLCASAILHGKPYVLPDTTLDPTALTNPLVAGEAGFRFYAAAPLTTREGHNLGTLCVLDYRPRQIGPKETELLSELAAVVMDEMELRLSAIRTVLRAEQEQRQAQALATTLQASLMPPRLPVIRGLSLASAYRPAGPEAVGGDFYDVFPLGDGKWAFVVGDVCGKGPRAAAATAAARYAVRADAVHETEPVEVLRRVNQGLMIEFADDPLSSEGMARFCTLCLAVLTLEGGVWTVDAASGGHPAPRIVGADGRCRSLPVKGTALGLFQEATFEGAAERLHDGDTVVMFTDGFPEARRRETGLLLEESGFDRLLSDGMHRSAETMAGDLVSLFDTGHLVQSDDAALLVIGVADR